MFIFACIVFGIITVDLVLSAYAIRSRKFYGLPVFYAGNPLVKIVAFVEIVAFVVLGVYILNNI